VTKRRTRRNCAVYAPQLCSFAHVNGRPTEVAYCILTVDGAFWSTSNGSSRSKASSARSSHALAISRSVARIFGATVLDRSRHSCARFWYSEAVMAVLPQPDRPKLQKLTPVLGYVCSLADIIEKRALRKPAKEAKRPYPQCFKSTIRLVYDGPCHGRGDLGYRPLAIPKPLSYSWLWASSPSGMVHHRLFFLGPAPQRRGFFLAYALDFPRALGLGCCDP
jgi:hypothetical protein